MLKEGPREPVFQVASKPVGPMVPVSYAGENEVVRHRAPPHCPCVVHPALRQGLGEPLEIEFKGPHLQREGVVILKKVFANGISKDPESLADGMTPFLSIRFRPEKVRYFLS